MINGNILPGLSHSSYTNLKVGKISNHDATLLIMASSPDGLSKTREVIEALRKWRGNDTLKFTYLFNTSSFGGYGFVGKDVNSVSNQVYHCSEHGDCYTQRRTYWYRVKNGTYRLTLKGFLRLAELEAQLS